MVKGFWGKLAKPILALAPMADVTDAAFRRIIAKYGKPDVIYTEFTSADGLCLANEKGKAKLMKDLLYSESERPIVAQFFTSRPEMMERAARLARDLKFDGVDINMGCPDRSVERQDAGAALMKNPARAKELIAAAKQGAAGLPVSVKTRLGYNKDELETWLPTLLGAGLAAITIHARTRKEMSLVPARWERVKAAVAIRNNLKSQTLILGNGDVADIPDAKEKIALTGADGVMLGRAIFGNPWLFAVGSSRSGLKSSPRPDLEEPTVQQRLLVMLEHTKLFEEFLGGVKSFAIMKKHFKAYVSGYDRAKELRAALMEAESAADVARIVNSFLTLH